MPQLLQLSKDELQSSNVFNRLAVDCVGYDIVNIVEVNFNKLHVRNIKPVSSARLMFNMALRGTEKFSVIPTECTSTCVTEVETGLVTMVPVAKFFEYVSPSVQGCPFSMVESAILNASAEFCEKTSVWRQDSKLTDIYQDTARYAFAPAPGAQVCTAEAVRVDGQMLRNTDIHSLNMLDPDWVNKSGATPQLYFFDTSQSITLIPKPSEDKPGAMIVSVILKPTKSATMLPSVLFNDWAEVVAAGALKRLLAMKGKAWANESLVPLYDRDFRAGISQARTKTEKSWSRSTKDVYSSTFYK